MKLLLSYRNIFLFVPRHIHHLLLAPALEFGISVNDPLLRHSRVESHSHCSVRDRGTSDAFPCFRKAFPGHASSSLLKYLVEMGWFARQYPWLLLPERSSNCETQRKLPQSIQESLRCLISPRWYSEGRCWSTQNQY